MSEMNPIEREQKKKQLRGRVIDTATQDMFSRRGISHGENEEEVLASMFPSTNLSIPIWTSPARRSGR